MLKLLLATLFFSFSLNQIIWCENFEKAQVQAQTEQKVIILYFSGSDWCGPCIKLKKEVLETEVFQAYASEKLVLVRADFPRSKKNQLSSEQTAYNENLAEKFNPEGKFPFTVLLNAQGKKIKSWDGYPKNMTATSLIAELKTLP